MPIQLSWKGHRRLKDPVIQLWNHLLDLNVYTARLSRFGKRHLSSHAKQTGFILTTKEVSTCLFSIDNWRIIWLQTFFLSIKHITLSNLNICQQTYLSWVILRDDIYSDIFMLIAASNRIDMILQMAGHNNYLNHGMSLGEELPVSSNRRKSWQKTVFCHLAMKEIMHLTFKT